MVARDIALAELTGGRLHVAHVSTARRRRRWSATRARAASRVTRRGRRRTTSSSPRRRSSDYDTNAKMAPPLRTRGRRRGAARRRSPTARSTPSRPTTRRTTRTRRTSSSTRRRSASSGSRRRWRSALRLVAEGVLDLPTLVARMTHRPGAHPRPAGRHARARRAGRRDARRPRAALEGRRRARFRSKSRNTPFEGWDVTGRAVAVLVGGRLVYEERGRRRRRCGCASVMGRDRGDAVLALADGTVFRGRAFGAARRGGGRARLQHQHDGLPGDPHRPVVRGAARRDDVPRDRQRRRQPRGRRVAAAVRARLRRARVPRGAVVAGAPSESLGALPGARHGIPGIEGIDTRALVRHLRDHGAQEAVLSSGDLDAERLVRKAKDTPSLVGRDLVREVTCAEPYDWDAGAVEARRLRHAPTRSRRVRGRRAVQGRRLRLRHQVQHPAQPGRRRLPRARRAGVHAGARGAGARGPTASSSRTAPAIPTRSRARRRTWPQLLGKVPVFGICLGHQILGLALGGQTYKLKFGHHGGNQPVKDLTTGKVEITAQNHGFAVDVDSLARPRRGDAREPERPARSRASR